MNEKHINAADARESILVQASTLSGIFEGAHAEGRYVTECREPKHVSAWRTLHAELDAFVKAGDVIRAAMAQREIDRIMEVAWHQEYKNLVLTAGKNKALDAFIAGSAYTAAWYLGLVDGGSAPTFAAGDTSASHAGWTENTGYSSATRLTPAWSAASGGSKAMSAGLAFSGWGAAATIAGSLLATTSTKGSTSDTIYSAGAFTGGNQPVTTTSTLTVTWTGSM